MKKKIVGILVCMLLIATTIPVAISVNCNESENTVFLDGVDQDSGGARNGALQLSSTSSLAQSFKPSLPKLTRVYLYLRTGPEEESDVIVSIYDKLDKNNLGSTIINTTEITPDTWVWVEFDFEDIRVAPDTTYYIVVDSNDKDNKNVTYWGCNRDNPYSRGQAWKRKGPSDWEAMPDTDFLFKTYGDTSKSKGYLFNVPSVYHSFGSINEKMHDIGFRHSIDTQDNDENKKKPTGFWSEKHQIQIYIPNADVWDEANPGPGDGEWYFKILVFPKTLSFRKTRIYSIDDEGPGLHDFGCIADVDGIRFTPQIVLVIAKERNSPEPDDHLGAYYKIVRPPRGFYPSNDPYKVQEIWETSYFKTDIIILFAQETP